MIATGLFLIRHQHAPIQARIPSIIDLYLTEILIFIRFLCKKREVNGRDGNLIRCVYFIIIFLIILSNILINHPLDIDLLHKNLGHALSL